MSRSKDYIASVGKYIGLAEAAEILGDSRENVRRLIHSGELPHFAKLPGRTGSFVLERKAVLAYRDKGK